MAISKRSNAGQIVIGLMLAVVVVGLVMATIYDPCPQGFVRECGTVVFGKLIGHNCECTPT